MIDERNNETRAEPSAPAALNVPERYEDLPRERLADEIEHQSSDGRPANPGLGPRRIGLLLVAVASIMIGAGVVAALFVDRTALFVIPVLGIVLLLANPAVWGSVLRAEDRTRAAEHLRHEVEDEARIDYRSGLDRTKRRDHPRTR